MSEVNYDGLGFVASDRLREARRAGVARASWIASGSDRLMTFVQFKKEKVRNRILKDFGRPPILLPKKARAA